MTPQIITATIRGALITLLTAVATFGALYGTGADQRQVVSGVIAAAIPVALGFLSYGQYDSKRAASGEIHRSDVGYSTLRDLTAKFNLTLDEPRPPQGGSPPRPPDRAY